MDVSHRISGMSPSPTVALNAKAKELAQSGVKVVNFSVGEPDFATPQAIINQAIKALESGRTKYGAAGGGNGLRQAIQLKTKRDQALDYDLDQIVAGIGAKEILFHLSLALLNEGDEVILPAPYWVSYEAHAEAAGAKALGVAPLDENLRIDIKAIEEKASAKTKLIILNSPNNPAGYVLTRQELQELGSYLLSKDWWIISDEIYEYMSFDSEHLSLLNVCPELRDRFILVNGLSKGFAMTGWRVGYCCAPKPIAKLVQNLQSQSSTCIPGFIEDAATFALNEGRPLMANAIDSLIELRDLALEVLSSIDDISFGRAEGAFYVFIDLRQILAKSQRFAANDSLGFSEYLLEEHRIAMVPGEAFGAPGFLRLSYATSRDILREGLQTFSKAIDQIR